MRAEKENSKLLKNLIHNPAKALEKFSVTKKSPKNKARISIIKD
jgi:hypothetical protein